MLYPDLASKDSQDYPSAMNPAGAPPEGLGLEDQARWWGIRDGLRNASAIRKIDFMDLLGIQSGEHYEHASYTASVLYGLYLRTRARARVDPIWAEVVAAQMEQAEPVDSGSL